jgi:hypothetical protein
MIILLGLLIAVTSGCSMRMVEAPINPYVDPDVNRFSVSRVAVLPFVIPDYLEIAAGAEAISVEMTNRFIAEMTGRRLVPVMDSGQVKQAIADNYPSPRDWMFNGTMDEAVAVARSVQADGVVFGRVTKYIQGNLGDSEVEIELTMMDLATMSTIWSIRELVIGKGGPEVFTTSTEPALSARACSIHAIEGASEKVQKIYKTGGPIKVSTVSTRQVVGYSLVSVGAVSMATSAYYMSESLKYYKNYENASSDYDLARYREKTQQSDLMWQVWGGVGLVTLGTGVYLLVTDHKRIAQGPVQKERRFVMAPTVHPGGGGLTCLFRF